MEVFSDPFRDHLGSSPPPTTSQDLGELPNSPYTPTPRPTTQINLNSTPITLQFEPIPSSDPLGLQNFHSATTHRHTQSRKRGPSSQELRPQLNKDPPNTLFEPHQAQELIFQARDLIVKACSFAYSRSEQSKLLDLLEIFREYTEKGVIQKTSTILATQIANLEVATKKIETQTRIQSTQQTQNQQKSWASIASQENSSNLNPNLKAQEWTKVTRKGSSSGISTKNTNSTTREKAITIAKETSKKTALTSRCTLLRHEMSRLANFLL
jgi:hypothetical protein